MNKKTTKLLVSLLSVLMVLSFMPAMAFADPILRPIDGPGRYHGFGAHNVTLDKDATIKPTCTTFGVGVMKCEGEDLPDEDENDYHLDCNATFYTLLPYQHDPANARLTKAEYMEELAAQGGFPSLESLSEFIKETDEVCYAYVNQCSDCKEYLLNAEWNNTSKKWEGGEDWEGHVAPAKTPDCAESFICEVCGQEVEVAEPAPHNWKYKTEAELKEKGYVGTKCADPAKEGSGVKIYENECKDCGKKKQIQVPGENVKHAEVTPKYTATQWEAMASEDKEKESPYLIYYKDAYYVPNDYAEVNATVKAPTCSNDSTADYGLLVCPECGEQLTDVTCQVKATGHIPYTVTTEATCDTDGFEATYCLECAGLIKEGKKTSKTGHNYKKTVLVEPTVYDDGITLIQCDKCGEFTTNDFFMIGGLGDYHYNYDVYRKYHSWRYTVRNSKYNTEDYKGEGDWYFVGFNREYYDEDETDLTKTKIDTAKAIKLDSWYQLEPHIGAYEDFAEATCAMPKLQLKKDTVSGDFVVHTLKYDEVEGEYYKDVEYKEIGKSLGHEKMTVTVAPTCGTPGYTYDSCTRCKLIHDPDDDDWDVFNPAWDDPSEWAYDVKDPLVAAGAECQFEWTVTKAPTATEDGEKALVCKVCGAVKAGSQTVVPKDSDEAKDVAIEAATPAIEAAATVMSDQANYKADSVKAIEEARTMLNQAIAAGTAADVTRAAQKLQEAVNAAAKKDANPMTAKGKTVKANSKKKTTFSAKKAFTVKKAQGKVTYKKKSGNAKVKIAKNGKVTVKKGLKKGKTYKIKVTVKAAGNGNYLAKSKVVTLKVKVTK